MLYSTWARSPAQTDTMILGGVIIAAVATIAAVPAPIPNECRPSVVHFMAEPKPLLAKPVAQAADWPVLERLALPYSAQPEQAQPEDPRPALIQAAATNEAISEADDEPVRRRRRHHRWR